MTLRLKLREVKAVQRNASIIVGVFFLWETPVFPRLFRVSEKVEKSIIPTFKLQGPSELQNPKRIDNSQEFMMAGERVL